MVGQDPELSRERKKTELLNTMGAFRLWRLRNITSRFRKGSLPEVEHDLLIVQQFANRVDRTKLTAEQAETLGVIHAYLDVAAVEISVGKAWRYINAADSLLPLVVQPSDIDVCEHRLQLWDGSLDDKWAKRLEFAKKELEKARTSKIDEDKRRALNGLQTSRSQIWNEFNNRIELKQALWRGLGRWVLFATIVAIGVCMLAKSLKTGEPFVDGWPFCAAALLGFFGGALSALVRARTVVIDIPSYRSVKMHTVLRMLIGAAGALVVYVVAIALPLGELTKGLQTSVYMFLSVCIAAGFSERMFIQALEEVSKNLKSVA